MYVLDESTQGFLSTFHNQDQISIAILVLAQRKDDIDIYRDLLDGVVEVDEALGREIGMFLAVPAHIAVMTSPRTGDFLRDRSSKSVDKGEKLKRLRDLKYFDFTQTQEFRLLSRAAIAGRSVEIVSEFAAVFGIDSEHLPCVCVLIKGVEGATVIESEGDLSYRNLVLAATEFKKRLAPIKIVLADIVDGLGSMKSAMDNTEMAQKRMKSLNSMISDALNTLQRKYKVTLSPQFVAAINSGNLTSNFIDDMFRDVGGSQYNTIIKDSRAKSVMNWAGKWQRLNHKVRATVRSFDLNSLTAKSVAYDSVVREINESARASFSSAGISKRSMTIRYTDILKYVPATLGLLAKAFSLLTKAGT